MSRSRKKNRRTKKRHHKQLKEQHQREVERESKHATPELVPSRSFWRRHVVEFIFLLFLALGIGMVYWQGPDKGAMKEATREASSDLEMRLSEFEKRYPEGYKIIALVGRDIVPTSFDTLPEELEIKWKSLFVNLVQTRTSDGGLVEKVELEIPDMDYAPAGIAGRALKVSFIRKAGIIAVLTELEIGQKFVIEVVEDREDRFFCLFGIR